MIFKIRDKRLEAFSAEGYFLDKFKIHEFNLKTK
jgi:hypothetical protein